MRQITLNISPHLIACPFLSILISECYFIVIIGPVHMTHGTAQLNINLLSKLVKQLTVTISEEGMMTRELRMVIIVVPVECWYLQRSHDTNSGTTIFMHCEITWCQCLSIVRSHDVMFMQCEITWCQHLAYTNFQGKQISRMAG